MSHLKVKSRIKVLDLSRCIAGLYCTRMLAGFSPDAIKIEKCGEGDPVRHICPFLNDEPSNEGSGLFLNPSGPAISLVSLGAGVCSIL